MAFTIISLLHRLLARPFARVGQLATARIKSDPNWRIDRGGKCGKNNSAAPGAKGDNQTPGAPATQSPQTAQGIQQAADASQRENTAVETRVGERTLELERVNERLRQTQFELMQHEKMSMLGQLASSVAHEVNTPTGAILNASVDAGRHLREFLVLAMDPDEFDAGARKWLAEMFESLFRDGVTRNDMAVRNERRQVEKQLREAACPDARRMAEIVVAYGKQQSVNDEAFIERLSRGPVIAVLEHVLALKVSSEISEASAKKIARIVRSLRLYAHSGQGESVDVDVSESVDNMLVVMQNRIKHVAQVERSFGEHLPLVRCGADLLQVWTNILSNACDAIELARGPELGIIEVVTEMDGEFVVVKIRNTGPPIAQEHMTKLFTPFFTTKGLGRGTGLGLSICVGILKRYGGTIAAMNELGHVVFEVRLPKAYRASNAQEAPGKTRDGAVAIPSG